MNKIEAKEVAREEINKPRKLSYADLSKRIDKVETFEVVGKSGVKYQLEIQYMWDDPKQPNGNVRVWVNIDDGGWRAFKPMSECFIISSEGKFIGE